MLRSLKALLLLAFALPAFAAYQPIITTPGSADNLASGGAKLDANFVDLYGTLYAPITGDVSIASGTNHSSINPGSVTLADFANFPANSYPCNLSGSSAAPSWCTPGTGSGGGTSSAYNTLNLCSYTGGGQTVDPNGVNDSLVAVNNAFQTYGGTNTVIQVNCPIYLHMGNSANQIYVKAGTNVMIGPTGQFIVDNTGVNVFVWVNVRGGTWTCANVTSNCIEYSANAGALMAGCGLSCGPFAPGVSAEYSGLQSYLTAHGVSMGTTGQPSWQGQSPFLPVFALRGNTTDITFRNMSFGAPAGANPQAFMPAAVGLYFEWNVGATAASPNTPAADSANMSIPTDITFDHTIVDGVDMAFQGSCYCKFYNTEGKRYSDMQDGTGGSVTFATLGSTSATLPSPWTLATGQYAFTTTASQTICAQFTQGQTLVNNYLTCGSGTANNPSGAGVSTTLYGSPSLTVATGNIGGFNQWFAPPHLYYIFDQLVAGTKQQLVIQGTVDQGPFVTLLPNERPGGTLLSLKTSLTNNTIVDSYTSLRPEGFLDLEPCTSTCGGRFSNIYVSFNSQTPTLNGTPIWGWRIIGGPIQDVVFSDISIFDQATEPAAFPVNGVAIPCGSTDVEFRNFRIFLNDWPLSATWFPSYQFCGDHLKFQSEIHLAASSSTATFHGPFYQQGSNLVQNSDMDISVFGWRQFPMTFTANPAVNDTTETLLTAWPYSSGSCEIYLTDGSIRYATVTNNSTTLGTFTNGFGVNTPISTASSATGAVCGGASALRDNYTGYEARIGISQSGKGYGNHFHVRDVDANWEATESGQTTIEDWCQELVGTPTSPTIISFPNYFGIYATSWQVDTALVGATGTMNIGFSGGSQLLSGGTITTSNNQFPWVAPVTSTGNAVTLTPTGGTVTGGSAQLSVCARSVSTTH
jgi:hypothetical protein